MGQFVGAAEVGPLGKILLANRDGNADQLSKWPQYPVFQIDEQGKRDQDGERQTDHLNQVQQVDAGFGPLFQHFYQGIHLLDVVAGGRQHLRLNGSADLMLAQRRPQVLMPRGENVLVLLAQGMITALRNRAGQGRIGQLTGVLVQQVTECRF